MYNPTARITTVKKLIVGLLMGLCLTGSLPGVAQAVPRSFRDAAFVSSVQVRVQTRFGTQRRCTGYLFTTQGQVIAPYHAIADATNIEVVQADLGVFNIRRIRRLDVRADLAVLSLSDVLDPEPMLARLGDARTIAVGDSVHVLHHSDRGQAVLYDTAVTALGIARQLEQSPIAESFPQEIQMFTIEGPFDAGSAGGIICDESWNVIGMLVAGGPVTGGHRLAYAISSSYLSGLGVSMYDTDWKSLRTPYSSDAEKFDLYMGPAVKRQEFKAAMNSAYLCWFSPMYRATYSDPEFMAEINDKVRKNWFSTTGLVVDNLPIREISASQLSVWSATVNPWGVRDSGSRYMHFDAESLFTKRIYKNRQTEERIMTRHILGAPVTPGRHFIQYENRGANFKSSGIKRRNIDLQRATATLLDIRGLSLVQMDRLPPPPPGIGQKNPVKYELTRRPLTDNELIYGIRSSWLEQRWPIGAQHRNAS
jgi:hypothetical protein